MDTSATRGSSSDSGAAGGTEMNPSTSGSTDSSSSR
jgi:hypothetical protein